MPDSLQSVNYALTPEAPDFQRIVVSDFPFEQTITRLKEAIQAEDLWLIHEIDPQKLMARGGFEIPPARQLLFFHPRYLVRVLENDPNAIFEVPLKLIVMQTQTGVVTVRHAEVVGVFSRYSGVALLALELESILQKIRAAVFHSSAEIS
jgi:uncharacterized protein (DUF302 family)